MSKLSRKEREKENRRNEILQAAWEVFSSKDYGTATLDDIAEAAELSKGTIYLYFQNKADLFFSTLAMGVENLFSIAQEVILSHDDPVVGLTETIRRMLEFSDDNVGFFRILSSERAHFEMQVEVEGIAKFKERMTDIANKGVKTVTDYIQRGVDMGVFRQVNTEDAAFLLLEFIRGSFFRRIHSPSEFRISEKAESITSIFLDGVRKSG